MNASYGGIDMTEYCDWCFCRMNYRTVSYQDLARCLVRVYKCKKCGFEKVIKHENDWIHDHVGCYASRRIRRRKWNILGRPRMGRQEHVTPISQLTGIKHDRIRRMDMHKMLFSPVLLQNGTGTKTNTLSTTIRIRFISRMEKNKTWNKKAKFSK